MPTSTSKNTWNKISQKSIFLSKLASPNLPNPTKTAKNYKKSPSKKSLLKRVMGLKWPQRKASFLGPSRIIQLWFQWLVLLYRRFLSLPNQRLSFQVMQQSCFESLEWMTRLIHKLTNSNPQIELKSTKHRTKILSKPALNPSKTRSSSLPKANVCQTDLFCGIFGSL